MPYGAESLSAPLTCRSSSAPPPPTQPSHSQVTEPRSKLEGIWGHKVEATLHDGSREGMRGI